MIRNLIRYDEQTISQFHSCEIYITQYILCCLNIKSKVLLKQMRTLCELKTTSLLHVYIS